MARNNTEVKSLVIANGIPIFMKPQHMRRPRMPTGQPTSAKLIVSIRPCNGLHHYGSSIWSPREEIQPPQRVIINREDIYKGSSLLETGPRYKFNQLEQIEEITELDSSESQTFGLKSCTSQTHINRLGGGCLNWKKKNKAVKDEDTKKEETGVKENSTALGDNDMSGSFTDALIQRLGQIDRLEKEIEKFSHDLKDIRSEISPLNHRNKMESYSTYVADINEVLVKLKQKCISLQGSIDKIINDNPEQCQCPASKAAAHSADNTYNTQDIYTEIPVVEKELPPPSGDKTYGSANIKTEQYPDTYSESQKDQKIDIKVEEVSQTDIRKLPIPPLPPLPPFSGSNEFDVGNTQKLLSNSPNSTNSVSNLSRDQTEIPQNVPIVTYGLTPQSIPKMLQRMDFQKPNRVDQQSTIPCTCHSGPEKSINECQTSKLPINFRSSALVFHKKPSKSHESTSDQSISHKRKRRRSVESNTTQSPQEPPETMYSGTPSTAASKKSSKSSIITHNLYETICDLIEDYDPNYIALTVIVKTNNLYYINISVTNTGESLGDICATEEAVKQAKSQKLFRKFLTFFILNSKFTTEQKNTILGHSFQLIDTESGRKSNFESRSHRTKNKNPRQECSTPQEDADLKTEKTANTYGSTDQTRSGKSAHRRIPGGIGDENFKKPNQAQRRGPFVYTGRYYDMSNYLKHHNSASGVRISQLEEQVEKLRDELTNIRDELVPQNDIIRFSNLSDRLQELNDLLKDLRKTYEDMNNPQKKNEYAAYDKGHCLDSESHMGQLNDEMDDNETENDKKRPLDYESYVAALDKEMENMKISLDRKPSPSCEKSDIPKDNYAPPESTECKQFLDEIKNPSNLFERHLLMMKDFRTDAELRRQRLLRKRQEKTELNAMRAVEENGEKPGVCKCNANKDNDWMLYRENAMKEECSSQSTQTEDALPNSLAASVDTTPLVPAEMINILSPNRPEPSSSDVIIESDLAKALKDIIDEVDMDPSFIVLTITLECNNLYHINIWTTSSARSLNHIYATEEAIQEAEAQAIFGKFLTYIVVSETNTPEQKQRLLRHSFKIIKEHQ